MKLTASFFVAFMTGANAKDLPMIIAKAHLAMSMKLSMDNCMPINGYDTKVIAMRPDKALSIG